VAAGQDAMRQAIAAAGPGDIAVGLSVQAGCRPVDAGGSAPRHPGMDTRTGAQNQWLDERFGNEWLFQTTGMPIHTVNTLPKLLWLKQHEQEIWKSAWRFLLYEDFLIHKMTGQPAISRCLFARKRHSQRLLVAGILAAMELEPGVWRQCSRRLPQADAADLANAPGQTAMVVTGSRMVCGRWVRACPAGSHGLHRHRRGGQGCSFPGAERDHLPRQHLGLCPHIARQPWRGDQPQRRLLLRWF
jgi:hypothetical protein